MAAFRRQVSGLRDDYGIARSNLAYWLGPEMSVPHARAQIERCFSGWLERYPELRRATLSRMFARMGGDFELFNQEVENFVHDQAHV